MDFLLLIFLFVCLYGLNIQNNIENSNYLSIQKTQSVKGIFILLVFFSHFTSYGTFTHSYDQIFLKIVPSIGQIMVTMFLFYSGFGVMESIKKKGINYVNQIPKKRILGTLVKFDIAVMFYAILSYFLNNKFGVKQFIFSLIGWDSLGNSNWYIFCILMLYGMTYIAYKFFSKKGSNYYISVLMLFVLICGYIVVLNRFNLKEVWWYDTALCYFLGVFYSVVHIDLEKICTKHPFVYLISLLSLFFLYLFFKTHDTNLINHLIHMVVFSAFFIILTMYVSFDNRILRWFGKNLFEIYILQRIPMIVLKEVGIADLNLYLYFILSLIFTIVLSIGFKRLCDFIWKKLSRIIGLV